MYFVTSRLHPSQARLDDDERAVVVQTIRHFDKVRYGAYCWPSLETLV
jgi:hypothetical protein